MKSPKIRNPDKENLIVNYEELIDGFNECFEFYKTTQHEKDYLLRSAQKIDEYFKQYALKENIRHIIIGEAPLFGAEESYIYNPSSRPTSFLRPSDFPNTSPPNPKDAKKIFLKKLQEYRILILDCYPLAINTQNETPSLDWGKISKTHQEVLNKSFNNFCFKKIKKINKNKNVNIIFRYKRNYLQHFNFLSSKIEQNIISGKIYSIHKQIFCDKNKFNEILIK